MAEISCEVCGRTLKECGHLQTDPRPRRPGTAWGMTRCTLCASEGLIAAPPKPTPKPASRPGALYLHRGIR